MNRLCNIKKWYVPLVFFNLFIIVSLLVNYFEKVTFFDIKIIVTLQKLLSFVDVNFWVKISALHHNWCGIIIVLFTLFMVYKKDYKLAILYFVCDYNAHRVITFVKEIFQRHRPPFELQPIEHPLDYSYPSGHSFNIMIFLGFLIIAIQKYVENRIIKYILTTICICLIILVGLSRNMLGVHYPSDVIGGFLLGLTLISAIWIISKDE